MKAEIKREVRGESRMKVVFGYINADKGEHAKYSFRLDLKRQGAGCRKSLKA